MGHFRCYYRTRTKSWPQPIRSIYPHSTMHWEYWAQPLPRQPKGPRNPPPVQVWISKRNHQPLHPLLCRPPRVTEDVSSGRNKRSQKPTNPKGTSTGGSPVDLQGRPPPTVHVRQANEQRTRPGGRMVSNRGIGYLDLSLDCPHPSPSPS